MEALAVIPARYASTRFPGKPLAMIGEKPMLRHVYDNVAGSKLFGRVVIATDDTRIANAAAEWHAEVLMTSAEHYTGTDRCAEALELAGGEYDVLVNVQGDEPFISAEPLQTLLSLFEDKETGLGTLVQQINDEEELENPNNVRVVRDVHGYALYFSRAVIPYPRSIAKEDRLGSIPYWKHIGIYAYRPHILREIVKLQPSMLEKAEMLEQLRLLENGYRIRTDETSYKMLSIDTQADLEKAIAYYERNRSINLK